MAKRTPVVPDAPFFAWADIGATGPDERLDYVIEVGLCITDSSAKLVEQTAITLVCNPGGEHWKSRLDSNPAMKDVHKRSGVLLEVPDGLSISEAEQALTQTLGRYGEVQDFTLAGGGISTTIGRRFLRSSMPRFEKWLRPTVFDVDSIAMAYRVADVEIDMPAPKRKRKPRLLDDIMYRIEQARSILEHLES